MSSFINQALKQDNDHNGIPDIADKAIAHFAPGHNGSQVNAAGAGAGGVPLTGAAAPSSNDPGHLLGQAKEMLSGQHGGGGAAGISSLLSQVAGNAGTHQTVQQQQQQP